MNLIYPQTGIYELKALRILKRKTKQSPILLPLLRHLIYHSFFLQTSTSKHTITVIQHAIFYEV